MKPTIYYVLVAGLLAFGLLTDRPLLQRRARHGLSGPRRAPAGASSPATGRSSSPSWRSLNEAVWRNSSTDFWIGFKLWGAIPLTFLFAARQYADAAEAWPDEGRRGCPPNRGRSNERPDPLHPRPAQGIWHRRPGAEVGRPRHPRAARFSRCSAPTAPARRR